MGDKPEMLFGFPVAYIDMTPWKLFVFESDMGYQFSVMAESEQRARELIDNQLKSPGWDYIRPGWPEDYKMTNYNVDEVCFTRLEE
jgi:hypothetical protein